MFPHPHTGGASTHLANLISQLSARRMLHGLIHGGLVRPSVAERLGYLAVRCLSRDAVRLALLENRCGRLRRLIARSAAGCPDLLIHCHDPLASCAALQAGLPTAAIVQTVHGPWSREYQMSGEDPASRTSRRIRQYEEQAFAGVDLALPVDRGQAAILAEEFAMPAERMRTIENAVDLAALAAIVPAGGIQGPRKDCFIVPRRLVPKNGVEYAIRGLARLGGCEATMLVAGDGPLRNSLERLAADLGVRRRVQFLGDVPPPRLLPLIKAAGAVLVPSVPASGVVEATSLAVLEAMALGVPVIGSAIGGIADILQDSDCGLLVPPGDVQSLAAAMRTVIEWEPAARRQLIQRAFARVRDRFAVERWIREIIEAYQQTAERRRPVIAADAGGTPELIAHERSGLLVPPADVDVPAAAPSQHPERHAA
jgi:glycosyltransferase involved in cell wall biosynthesis